MPVRRSVLKMLLASMVLPLLGKGALAAGVGLSFDLTLVSSRIFVEDVFDAGTGMQSSPRARLDPAGFGLAGDPRFAFPGIGIGETVTASFRRDGDRDWSLTLPERRYGRGFATLLETDPLSGLGSYMLSSDNRQIDLDFIGGDASFTADRIDVAEFGGDGSWLIYGDVRHEFAISNVMDQGSGVSMFAAASAYSSFGPFMATQSRLPPSAVVPVPAALLLAATGVAALFGLRRIGARTAGSRGTI